MNQLAICINPKLHRYISYLYPYHRSKATGLCHEKKVRQSHHGVHMRRQDIRDTPPVYSVQWCYDKSKRR